jgi:hypothetical protein
LPRRHLNLRRRFTTAWWYLIRPDLDWSDDDEDLDWSDDDEE